MDVNGSPLTFRLEKVVRAPQEVMEDFEGPLDLILHLLGRNKISIEDLQITLLCEQFTAWIEERRELDMEAASEFIAMASHLVYLKSKSLISAGEEDEEIDLLKKALEERLALEERQKMELIYEFLKARGDLHRQILTKPPEPLVRPKDYAHTHSANALTAALAEILERGERLRPPPLSNFSGIAGREPYPVKTMMENLKQRLANIPSVPLAELFELAESRSAVVAVFLAVLEMTRNGECEILEDGEEWRIVSSKPRSKQSSLLPANQ